MINLLSHFPFCGRYFLRVIFNISIFKFSLTCKQTTPQKVSQKHKIVLQHLRHLCNMKTSNNCEMIFFTQYIFLYKNREYILHILTIFLWKSNLFESISVGYFLKIGVIFNMSIELPRCSFRTILLKNIRIFDVFRKKLASADHNIETTLKKIKTTTKIRP